jgi:hypothetical protein
MFDIRLVLRSLRRNPGFAALSIFIVALGAGANASVFSVVRAVLIEPSPYARPADLVVIWPGAFVSNGDMDFLRARGRSFAQVASTSPGWTMSLLGAGDPVRVTATKTSANLFDLLGARPLMGRTFARDEDQPGRAHVAILSYQLWRSHFHGDPAVLGRMVTLEGAPHQIVGVMGADFESRRRSDGCVAGPPWTLRRARYGRWCPTGGASWDTKPTGTAAMSPLDPFARPSSARCAARCSCCWPPSPTAWAVRDCSRRCSWSSRPSASPPS